MLASDFSIPMGGKRLSTGAPIPATRAVERVRDRESEIRAWVCLRSIDDIGADERAAPAGPLRGTGIGIKDLIDVRGLPTRAGSPGTTSERPAGEDADCVGILREAGGVILGKTVTTEYGYFSPGPTRNPRRVTHTPGGSSSGSAAAVASGALPYALGTQTAGSLTRPASYCGVAGMTLSHSSVSLKGVTGLSPSLDSLGLLASGAEELHTLWQVFARQHVDGQLPQHVLFWGGQELTEIAPSMKLAMDRVIGRFESIGARVEHLNMPDEIVSMSEQHALIMAYEAARQHEALFEESAWKRISSPLRELLISGHDTLDSEYHLACEHQQAWLEQFHQMLGDCVIVGPAAPGPAPKGLDATGSPILSRPWQLLGLPTVTVPVAKTMDGLPLGVQIIGSPRREADLLAVGSAVQLRLDQAYP